VVKSWGCTPGPFIPYPLMLVRILGAPEVGRNHTGWGVSPSRPPPPKFLKTPTRATPDCSSQAPAERMSPPLIRTYVVPLDNIWSGSGYRNICPTAVFGID
jgi:hypothetical protein